LAKLVSSAAGLAVDNDHVVPALEQMPRGACADDAGAQDNDFHGREVWWNLPRIKRKIKL
jgi:hypothetical protein